MENLDGELRGILHKKGARFRGWKRRFFIAKDGVISYYKSEEGKGNPAGSFSIPDATVKLLHSNEKDGIGGHRFGITPASSERCYILQHPEQEVREMWIAYVLHNGGHWAVEENVYRGYLHKKGNLNTNWKRRFFVVEKGEMRWYEDAREKKKQGQIDVSDALVCVFDQNYDQELYEREDRQGLLFSIKPKKSERTFLLESDSKADLEKWLRVLPAQLESVVEKQICTLALCLVNRIGREFLIQFAKERACDENILFWLEAEAYRNLPRNPECLVPAAEKLCETFIQPGSSMEIGFLTGAARTKLIQAVKGGDCPEDLFLSCQRTLFSQLDQSLFPDFRASPLYQHAIKRLGEEETSLQSARRVIFEGLVEFRQELKVWKAMHLVATSTDLSFFLDAAKTFMIASFSIKQAKAIFLGEEVYFEEGKTIPGGFPFGLSFFGEAKPRVYQVHKEKLRVSWLAAFKEMGLEMLDSKNIKKEEKEQPEEEKEVNTPSLKGNLSSVASTFTNNAFMALVPESQHASRVFEASNLHDLFKKMHAVYPSPATLDLFNFSKMLKLPDVEHDKSCRYCMATTHKADTCPHPPSDDLLDLNRIRKLCETLDPEQSKCQCEKAGMTCVPMIVKSLIQCKGDQVLQMLWRAAFQGTSELASQVQRWTMRLLWLLADFTKSLEKCWGGKKMSTRVPYVEMIKLLNNKTSAVYYVWRDDGLESKFLPKKLSEISQFYDGLCDRLKGIVELPFISKVKRNAVHETTCMMRFQVDAAFETLTTPKIYQQILVTEKAREHLYEFLQVKSGTSQCTPEFFALNVTASCLTHRKERSLPILVLDVLQQILCGISSPRNLPVFWKEADAVEDHRKEIKDYTGQKVSQIKEPFVIPLVLAATAAVPHAKAISFLYELNHLLIVHPINSRQLVKPGFASWFMQLLFLPEKEEEEKVEKKPSLSPAPTAVNFFTDDLDNDDAPEKPLALNEIALSPVSLALNILVLCLQHYLVNYTKETKGKQNPLEPNSIGSVLSSIIVRIGLFKNGTDGKGWTSLHVRLVHKLVAALVGKLLASISAFRFQEDHPAWGNLFETLTVCRNLTWVPVGNAEPLSSNVDEDTVLKSPVACHLKSGKSPVLDYQDGRILLEESSVRGVLLALRALKLHDLETQRAPSPGERAAELPAIKALKGEGLANIAFFSDCLQAFKTARTMDSKTSYTFPTLSFDGQTVEPKSNPNETLLDRIISQFFCSYHFDKSFSKDVEDRLQAFGNYRAWSRGIGKGITGSLSGPITEDMKLLYMMGLGIPVYTVSAKKVKQCLLYLKERDTSSSTLPSSLTKKKEEEGKVYKYNIIVEHRRKKESFALAEQGSVCQVQTGVKQADKVVQCGLDWASNMSFSISNPKKRWFLDCVCLSWDTYNAFLKGLIKLLEDDKVSKGSVEPQVTQQQQKVEPVSVLCECSGGGTVGPDERCTTCGRPLRDTSQLSIDATSPPITPRQPTRPFRKSAAPSRSEDSGSRNDERSSVDESSFTGAQS